MPPSSKRKTFALPVAKDPCVVCGTRDLRALVSVELAGGEVVALCGSHELMHRRDGARATTVAELRAALGDRRSADRRAFRGEVDELAERLNAAFTRERRGAERRAS
jgi:hypothetical protein